MAADALAHPRSGAHGGAGVNVICAATLMAAVADIGRLASARRPIGHPGPDPRVAGRARAPRPTGGSRGGAPAPPGMRSSRRAGRSSAGRAAARLLPADPGPPRHGVATVARARGLARLRRCPSTRSEDHAFAHPAPTARKRRPPEIRAGAPTKRGVPTGTRPPPEDARRRARARRAGRGRLPTRRRRPARHPGEARGEGRRREGGGWRGVGPIRTLAFDVAVQVA